MVLNSSTRSAGLSEPTWEVSCLGLFSQAVRGQSTCEPQRPPRQWLLSILFSQPGDGRLCWAALQLLVVSDSATLGLQPARLLGPWGFSRQEHWEWVAMPSSGGSSQPRDWTQVSRTAGRLSTNRGPGKRWRPCYTHIKATPEHGWQFCQHLLTSRLLFLGCYQSWHSNRGKKTQDRYKFMLEKIWSACLIFLWIE